jgi:hypothetical protein
MAELRPLRSAWSKPDYPETGQSLSFEAGNGISTNLRRLPFRSRPSLVALSLPPIGKQMHIRHIRSKP